MYTAAMIIKASECTCHSITGKYLPHEQVMQAAAVVDTNNMQKPLQMQELASNEARLHHGTKYNGNIMILALPQT